MRVVALLSGGKDSLFNLYLATQEGHEFVAIANLKPPDDRDELDSYMYQTVGHQAIDLIAKALNKPVFRASITGTAIDTNLNYQVQSNDEVEQLFDLLLSIKSSIDFDAVSVGAIASSYQKFRVENICQRLNIKMLAYLWDQDQDLLLSKMIENKFDARLIKVACMGLGKDHVGLSIKDMQEHLRDLNRQFKTNICGEGGEYETLVLDCPLFEQRLILDSYDIVCHSDSSFAPVYYMRPKEMHLESKINT